jgi:ferredoxin/flavodoxin---NADP+ reductase
VLTEKALNKFWRATIIERRDLSDALWVIRVTPDGDFRFIAGQYATLGVESSNGLVERPYSIVSSPYEREIEFVIELVPQGALTPRLHELNLGDSLFIRRIAKGRFTLDSKSPRTRHLLLSTVTGIAPFVSYVRTLYRDWKDGRFGGEHTLFVLHGASHASELAYRDEMQQLADEAPWLTYVPTISRPWDDPAWTGETGRVDDVIRKYADAWALTADNATAYLCGHPDMIAHGKAILHRRRWAKEALREESFFLSAGNPAA